MRPTIIATSIAMEKSFDVGETFSGVDLDAAFDAVDGLKPLVPPGFTMAQFALKWILMFDAVSCVIPGAKRPDQVEDNCDASSLSAAQRNHNGRSAGDLQHLYSQACPSSLVASPALQRRQSMSKSNYVMAEDPTVDLAVLDAETAELEAYIVKDELYRTVQVQTPGGTQMIQMSGGDLLTRINRLSAESDQLTLDLRTHFDCHAPAGRADNLQPANPLSSVAQPGSQSAARQPQLVPGRQCRRSQTARSEYPFEIRNRQRIEVILQALQGDLRQN